MRLPARTADLQVSRTGPGPTAEQEAAPTHGSRDRCESEGPQRSTTRVGARMTRKTRRAGRRRRRPGTRPRQVVVACCASAVVGSLVVSVDRTAEGRRLAESINELRREQEVLRIRQTEELVRVDSLSSRDRILVAAARFGLRPASDNEVLHLPDVGP